MSILHHVADGTHHSALRWYVNREVDTGLSVVTVSGHVGARYVFEQAKMEHPTPQAIGRFVEQVIEQQRAALAKRGQG